MSFSNIKFALSLPGTEKVQLDDIDNIPEIFEKLELTGDLINEAAAIQREHRSISEFTSLNFRNLIPAPLTRQLNQENGAIVQSYKQQLRELMQKAADCGAEYISLDPDWETLFTDTGKRAVFDDILRSTAGDREYSQLSVAIAVRLPGSGQINAAESVNLLHKLANHKVQLALDINPHELLNADINWQDFLRHFRFDTVCVRLCYESDLGNKLMKNHIIDIIRALQIWQRKITVCLAPSGAADITGLAQLAESIKTEGNGL